jgi:flagellin
MALGVLNNLSAIYAENNLNNTSNSLQKVLEQLSSGSKINSGADDAAGLSLVNGLQANSQALVQSETNATEGVGLLDVADGALSQVTNLLDRAITLATEASNGTLNSSQEAAANQEYTTILAEINNIGSTTTYNQQSVFTGNTVAIYTGDSSTTGSSIDNLKIHTLSVSSVGDTNGQMSYSSGQDNVFIDLSNDGHNAAVTDSLNGGANGSTTINVGYINKGAQGALTQATAAISVGSGTSYANTAQGLIQAINNSGLGLTATFSTAAAAGDAAAATASAANNGGGSAIDTGIEISASGIGTGTSGAGVVGALSLAAGDTLGGTLTIVGADGNNHNITLGMSDATDTLANLESTINGAGYGVTASLNQAGTELTFTTADPKVTVSASNLTQNTQPTTTTTIVEDSGLGSLTVGNISDTLSGTLNIQEGASQGGKVDSLTLGQAGTMTLAQLKTTINQDAAYGITASLNTSMVNGHAAGTVLTFQKTNSDAGTPSISGSNIEDIADPTVAVGGTLGSLSVASASDTFATGASGYLTITSGIDGSTSTLNLGATGANATNTLANLAQTINNKDLGITAAVDNTGTKLTFTQTSGSYPAGIGGTGLVDTTYTTAPVAIAAATTLGTITAQNASDALSVGTAGSGLVLSGNGVNVLGSLTVNDNTSAADADAWELSGTLNLKDSTGGAQTINLATAGAGGTALTLNSLATYLNSGAGSGWGIHATYNAGTGTNPASLTFTSATGGSAAIVSSPGLGGATGVAGADTAVVTAATSAVDLGDGTQTLAQVAAAINGYTALDGVTAVVNAQAAGTHAAGTVLTLEEAPAGTNGSVSIAAGQTLTDTPGSQTVSTGIYAVSDTLGSLTVKNTTDTLSGVLDYTDASGNPGQILLGTTGTTDTLADLAATITGDKALGITASLNKAQNGVAAGTVLTFTANASDVQTPTITNNGNIQDTIGAVSNPTINVAPAVPGVNLGVLTAASSSDYLTGTLEVTNAAGVTTAYGYSGQTLAEIAASFNQPPGEPNSPFGSGITANLVGKVLTFTGAGNNAISGVGLQDYTPSSTTNETVATGTVLDTLTVAHAGDTVTGTIGITSAVSGTTTPVVLNANQTLADIQDDFAGINWGGGYQDLSTYGITATLNQAGTGLTFTQTLGESKTGNVTNTSLADVYTPAASTLSIAAGGSLANTLTVNNANDPLTGTLTIQEGADGKNTNSTYNLAGKTLAGIAADFNTGSEKSLGITATVNGSVLTFTQTPGDIGVANVTGSNLVDDTASSNKAITMTTGTMQDTLSVNDASDVLGGTLNITSGISGLAAPAITLGSVINGTDTLTDLAKTINSNATYGITANLNPSGTQLTFTQTSGGLLAAVGGAGITDSKSATIAPSSNLGSITVATAGDKLSGTLSGLEGDGVTAFPSIVLGQAGQTDTLANLANYLNVTHAGYGITAALNPSGTQITFSASSGDAGAPTLGNQGTLFDTTPSLATAISLSETPTSGLANVTDLGYLNILSTDTLSGTLNIGSNKIAIGSTDNTAATLATAINQGSYGISATYSAATGDLTFTSSNSSLSIGTSQLSETPLNSSTTTGVGALNGVATTTSGYYSLGISGYVQDTSTAVTINNATTYGGTQNVGITTDTNGAGGTATINYSDASGQSLSGTDLLDQTDAAAALNSINTAITDVAALDGYIGAQINTLQAIGSVLTTQQENVVSAQNALQATDYASATSSMSKYEILSQTGIAALAQANTVQQEVTKLLQ